MNCVVIIVVRQNAKVPAAFLKINTHLISNVLLMDTHMIYYQNFIHEHGKSCSVNLISFTDI